MNPTAAVLVIISTFMHAGWNLMVRGQQRRSAFIHRMLTIVAAAGLVPAAISEALARSLPPTAWACAVASGLCCGAYYFALARAYGSADFTTVYPVARALPVLLVACGDVVLGRQPSAAGWAGMVLVAGGCLLAPLRSLRDVRVAHYLNRASLWIVLTALATVGYTLFDKAAAEVVHKGPATAARYGYVFFLISYLAFSVPHRLLAKPPPAGRPLGWAAPALAAALNFGAYWLVLWAYQLARQAGYVVAFRQFSIVIGVVLAFAIFKESGRAVRLAGTALILAGLILIAIWGG